MKTIPSCDMTATINSEYVKNGDDGVIEDESEKPLWRKWFPVTVEKKQQQQE